MRKVNGVMTLRQLAPPLFVTCLAVGALLSPWSRLAAVALVLLLAIYAAVLAGCSIAVVRKAGWRVAIALCLVFPTLHISYGFGYLQGVLTFLVLRRRAREAAVLTPLSR